MKIHTGLKHAGSLMHEWHTQVSISYELSTCLCLCEQMEVLA